MKPAIDQMIAYLEGEMAKYSAPASYMDKGYRVLEQSRKQAEKIKERCDADDAALFDVAWIKSARDICEVDRDAN